MKNQTIVGVMADTGGNEKLTYSELTKELEKLRENDGERETRIKILTNDNRKTKERLKVLEGLIQSFQSDGLANANESTGNAVHREATNEQFVKTFIELSCECVVINKKLKYLRRLMKLNTQKLTDLENTTKAVGGKEGKLSEDKFCQTELGDDNVAVTSTSSQEFKSDGASPDADMLMSEMFYLPTHPDLPDLRLFNLL